MTAERLFPWGDSLPFYSFSAMMNNHYGGRIQKISLDAGFTCPNRDGTKGINGCTFCNNDAFNPSYCIPQKSIRQQIEEGMEFHRRRYRRAEKYLAYFQAYTNTYKPIEELDRMYQEALAVPGVAGLAIGTRPDCIGNDLLDYFGQLSQKKIILLEYGVESVYDQTLKRINRGHDFASSKRTINLTADKGLHCGIHLVFGLPGETMQMMLDSVNIISSLPVSSVKFHQLQIFRNTKMADEFMESPEEFHRFSLDAYIEFIVRYTERLNPSIAIERFAGEVPPVYLITEPWSRLRYDQLLNRIKTHMVQGGSWQGKLFRN
jgi:uncharacterized protein